MMDVCRKCFLWKDYMYMYQSNKFKPSSSPEDLELSQVKPQSWRIKHYMKHLKMQIALLTSFLIIQSAEFDCESRFSFEYDTCFLSSTHQMKCFGSATSGRLGYGTSNNRGDDANEMGDYLPFINVDENVISFRGGAYFHCVHLSTLDVKCWGSGGSSHLGYGDGNNRGDAANEMGSYLPTVQVGSSFLIVEVSSGRDHTLVQSDMGKLKSWGYGNSGRLGSEDEINRGGSPNQMGDYLSFISLGTGRTAIMILTGMAHSCVLLDDLSMKCWGQGSSGQCGQETVSDVGDLPNEMGNYLPPINFPSGVVIEKFGTGWQNNGIITPNGVLYMWGHNFYGQLGLGPSATKIGDNLNEMGNYLQSTNVGSGRSVVQVQGGSQHSCVILDNFNVKCFGRINYGQIGYGDNEMRGNDANEMGDYLPYVNLGSGLTAQSLHLGQWHSCVVLNDNSFKCFGRNEEGQLGIGNTDNQGNESNEMGDYLGPINLGTGVEIQECFDYSPTLSPSFVPTAYIFPTCSSRFSFADNNCILTPSSQLKCWGLGVLGMLGYGDTSNIGYNSSQNVRLSSFCEC